MEAPIGKESVNLALDDYNPYVDPFLIESLDGVDIAMTWYFEPNGKTPNSASNIKQEIIELFYNIHYLDQVLRGRACEKSSIKYIKDNKRSAKWNYGKIVDYIEGYVEFLNDVLDEIKCHPLKGAIAELLWYFRDSEKSFRDNKLSFAEEAINNYLNIIDSLTKTFQEYCKEKRASGVIEKNILLYSHRSLIIALETNDDRLIQKVLKQLKNLIYVAEEHSDDAFIVDLIKLFLCIKKPNQCWIKPYLDKLIDIAARQQKASHPIIVGVIPLCCMVWELAEELNKKLPQETRRKINFKEKYATALIENIDTSCNIPSMKLKMRLEASEKYKEEDFQNRCYQKIKTLKDECVEWQKTNIHTVSSPQLKIPNPAILIENTNTLGEAMGYLFGQEYWLDKNEIEKVESERVPNIFDFATKIPYVAPKTKQAVTNTRDTLYIDCHIGICGNLLHAIIQAIAKKYPNDIEELKCDELKWYLQGKYRSTAKEIVERFEGLLREFVQQKGYNIYNIKQGNDEGKHIPELLKICNESRLLDADLVLYTLNYLFDKKGVNCRNLIYHGQEVGDNILCYLCWVVIQILRSLSG